MGDETRVPPCYLVLCLFCILNMTVQRANSINDCAEMIFRDQPGDAVHGRTNEDIYVIFELVLDNCSSVEVLIKVTDLTASHNVEECVVIYKVDFCDVTRKTSACQCQSPSGPVIFSKRFYQPVNVTYRWTWHYLHSDKASASKAKEFIISAQTTDSSSVLEHHKTVLGSVLGTSVVCLFVVAFVAFVLCIRRVKRRQRREEQASATWYRRVDSPRPSQAFDDLLRSSVLDGIYNLPPLPSDLSSHERAPDMSFTEQSSDQDGLDYIEEIIREDTEYCPDDSFTPKSDSKGGKTDRVAPNKSYPYPL